MNKEKFLLKVMARIEKKYGNVCDDELGISYQEALNAIRTNDDNRKWAAAENLIEWEKHRVLGY